MNLHVFNDSHGFFLNLIVERFELNNALENNIFINLNEKTLYKNPKVFYIQKNIISYRKKISSIPKINRITFYPLDYVGAFFLNELRKTQPDVKVGWVFWSYEFYHRPDKVQNLFDGFSLDYFKKGVSSFIKLKTKLYNIIKKVLYIPVFNKKLLEESYFLIDNFYSFLEQDFKNVFKNIPDAKCNYSFLSFLSIEQVTKGVELKAMSLEVLVGHSPNPSLNHAEILDKLYSFSFTGKLLIPQEFGEEAYKIAIKQKAKFLFNDKVTLLEKRLPLQEYNERLSSVGFAIFNFKTQEALGNILFLIWNGTKIFLQKESSVYIQFKTWGFIIFSIEDDLSKVSLSQYLSINDRKKNKSISEELFSTRKIERDWKKLL